MKAGERGEFLRAAWRFLVSGKLDARDLVFVDECGSHTSLARLHGYSPRGERLVVEVPRNRDPNTTLLASMSVEGMGGTWRRKGRPRRRSSRLTSSGCSLRACEPVRWS